MKEELYKLISMTMFESIMITLYLSAKLNKKFISTNSAKFAMSFTFLFLLVDNMTFVHFALSRIIYISIGGCLYCYIYKGDKIKRTISGILEGVFILGIIEFLTIFPTMFLFGVDIESMVLIDGMQLFFMSIPTRIVQLTVILFIKYKMELMEGKT